MSPKQNDLKKTEEKVVTPAMRHPAIYTLSIVILVVIIISFIVGPILGESITNAGRGLVFGSYKGRDIEYIAGSYFARAYENQLQQLQSQAEQQNRELGLQDVYSAFSNAFDSTVFRYALIDEAAEAGIYVSSEEVTQTLAESPRFRDEEGNFSSELLRNAMSAEPGLRDQVREDLVFSRIQNDIFNAAALSEAEVAFIAETGKTRRVFDYLSLPFDSYPDEQAVLYLEENAGLFRSMELSSITLASLDSAESALERLSNREASFEDIAAAESTDLYADQNGNRGLVWFHDISGDFETEEAAELLFSLAEGEISEIFQLRNGSYALFRADSGVTEPSADNAEVLEQVKGYVLALERGMVADFFNRQALSVRSRAEEIGWESALAESGLSSDRSSAFPVNYGDVPLFPTLAGATSNVVAGASTREDLYTELFSLEPGQISQPIELRDKIVLMSFVEETQEDSQNDFLNLYIPYIAQDYLVNEMQRQYSSPENLEDDFDAVFSRAFLGGN